MQARPEIDYAKLAQAAQDAQAQIQAQAGLSHREGYLLSGSEVLAQESQARRRRLLLLL